MVHHNKLVAAIKVGGHVLRESKDNTVFLPFGAEYSVLIKNLDSRRIKFKLSIDGKDATDGTWLVVHPNSSLELERFVRAGNLNGGNRFKFIERTPAIEAHRGVQLEDGLLRIEWFTERAVVEVPRLNQTFPEWWWDWPPPAPPEWPRYPRPRRPFMGGLYKSAERRSLHSDQSETPRASMSSGPSGSSGFERVVNFSDEGITVPGSESHQQFYQVPNFETESTSDVLVIKLRGQIGAQPVAAPVTVDYKPDCPTCGTRNKATSKYCTQCGTALTLF